MDRSWIPWTSKLISVYKILFLISNCAAQEVNFTAPPQNISVTRGSNVSISCGHMIAIQRPTTWIINGTSFNQDQILFSPLYRQNRQGTPTEFSLTVFSINGTTTFKCVVQSTPNTTTSTLGTVTVIDIIPQPTIIMPPENTTVCRGSDVTISCGHVVDMARPVKWIINRTSFSQDQLFLSPLYQQNRQGSPTENTLTVFSINGTTTFQCVVQSTPTTTSTVGTVTVIDAFILQNCDVTSLSIGTIRVSCDSSHQILVTLTCTNNCCSSNPIVTSSGSSPLTVTGLDPGVTYSVTINVFDGDQVVLSCETVAKFIAVMAANSGSCTPSDSKSDDSSLSTGAVAAVTCIVTLIISVTVSTVITFVITYVCVKRKLENKNEHTHQSTEEKVFYEQVSSPTSTITKNNLELQPNPAYGVSNKVNMDSNPAYQSCK